MGKVVESVSGLLLTFERESKWVSERERDRDWVRKWF